MWSKNGRPVDTATWPVPSTHKVTEISVSLVDLVVVAWRRSLT
jgi:hypothetical protein